MPYGPFEGDEHLFDGCTNIFMDVGAMYGTNIRKLFEPAKYLELTSTSP